MFHEIIEPHIIFLSTSCNIEDQSLYNIRITQILKMSLLILSIIYY